MVSAYLAAQSPWRYPRRISMRLIAPAASSLALSLLGPLCTACSSDRASTEERSPVDRATGPLKSPPEGAGVQLRQTFGPLAPGKETHFCQYYVLPDEPVDVARFQHTYTQGGHHIILYPTRLAAADVADRL